VGALAVDPDSAGENGALGFFAAFAEAAIDKSLVEAGFHELEPGVHTNADA
jgi:hypothetical protein